MTNPKTIIVDGVEYVRADAPKGTRAIIVVDRGWIFCGDVTRAEDGRITLTRAVWVFSWKSVGFAAIVSDPSKADIRPMPGPVELPHESEIFAIPVGDTWGL